MFRGIIITFTLIIGVASAATYYVPGDYPTIQDAINACMDGDVVIVRPGTYVENIDFVGKAITVKSESGPDVTTVDGNQAGSVVTFGSGEGLDSIFDGFTLTNGTGNDIWGTLHGGGICCEFSSPTITNNTVSGNSAYNGGGISCQSSSPIITNNTIAGNTSEFGGGIQCFNGSAMICDNIIKDNSSILGGFRTPGGGISLLGNNHSTVSFNILTDNSSGAGGAIGCGANHAEGCSPVISCNFIYYNSAQEGGGIACYKLCCGIVEPTIINNTITGNVASGPYLGNGGGIFFSCYGSIPIIANNTITGNLADLSGGGIFCYDSSPVGTNTVLWNNSAPTGKEISITFLSTLSISYSDVEGGQSSCHVEPGCTLNWGAGMIDADPLFADSTNGDFHLTWDSPCKNTGDNSSVFIQLDFEKDPRIWDGTVDIGADEFHTHLYHMGAVSPGGKIQVKIIGDPGITPVTLALGSGIQDPPQSTPLGDLYLILPPVKQWNLGSIPSNGVRVVSTTVPTSWQAGSQHPFQALLGPLAPGSVLSNLMVLTVE